MKTKTKETKAADKHKVAADIFRALGKVTAEPKDCRPRLERVCLQRPDGTDGLVRFEATDGKRAVRVDVREDMLPDGLASGRYGAKMASGMLGRGQIPDAPEDATTLWPDFDQCIPQRTDEAQAPQHYDPALLGATLAVVAALTAALQGKKTPRATRVQLGEDMTPCRVDVSGEGWSIVAVTMPMREW